MALFHDVKESCQSKIDIKQNNISEISSVCRRKEGRKEGRKAVS
jgi:hypothetical protein